MPSLAINLSKIPTALLSSIERFRQVIERRVEDFGAPYIAFGIFGILNYPIFYFIWIAYDRNGYESLAIRSTATILCGLLLVHNYWPKKLKLWLPVYWYFTLLFCIPFFFFFMVFKNSGSATWLMIANTIIFWLLIMVDWWDYVFLLFIGIFLAFIAYVFSVPEFHFNFEHWWGVYAQFIASFIVVAFFTRRKLQLDKQKLRTIAMISDSVAHELRTPLRTILSCAKGLKKYLPQLIAAYPIAKDKEPALVEEIDEFNFDALTRALDNIVDEVKYSFIFIDMLLVNASELQTSKSFQTLSMAHCVSEAITRYPFDLGDKEFVSWEEKKDFMFQGDEQLMIHIIFNLLKNAIYYVRAAGKGKIFIWIETTEKYNQLHFKDTGTGISKKFLPYIFDRFFSKTYHGTGIGLAFCKLTMKSFGGDIIAQSVEGEYTEFIMYFPKISSAIIRENGIE